jgi:hypothetical protein
LAVDLEGPRLPTLGGKVFFDLLDDFAFLAAFFFFEDLALSADSFFEDLAFLDVFFARAGFFLLTV